MIQLFLTTCSLIFVHISLSYSQSYTKGEVYNFNIGDEFHYKLNENLSGQISSSSSIDRVVNKVSTATHLIYTINSISPQNSTIVLSTRYDSILLSTLNHYIIDTIPSNIAGDTISTDSIYQDSAYCHTQYLQVNSTLNFPPNYDPPYWRQHFVRGLGETYYYRSQINGFSFKRLVYFKKASNSCGVSVYTTSSSKLPPTTSTSIGPNPFKNQLYISFFNYPPERTQLHLYNHIGQEVFTQTLSTKDKSTIIIDTALPKGIYYAVLQWGNQQQVTKLIKQ